MKRRRLLLKKWTERRACAATLTRLKKIDDLLIEIAGLWGDEDQCLVDFADDLRTTVANFRSEMDESIKERAERRAAEMTEGLPHDHDQQ